MRASLSPLRECHFEHYVHTTLQFLLLAGKVVIALCLAVSRILAAEDGSTQYQVTAPPASLSNATKNQSLSQGGWRSIASFAARMIGEFGCQFLVFGTVQLRHRGDWWRDMCARSPTRSRSIGSGSSGRRSCLC